MSATLLEKMLARVPPGAGNAQAPGAGAQQSGAAAAGGGHGVSGPARAISALRRGRFGRWHIEPGPPQEDEGWLFAYLDVVTLLLAVVVVMLAFSPPLQPLDVERQEVAPASAAPLQVQPAPPPEPPAAAVPLPPLPAVPDALGAVVATVVDAHGVTRLRISSEVLFRSGEAALTPAGERTIDALVPTLKAAIEHTIVVEGHTDDVPIATERFPSNWELGASRAAAVVRHLETRGMNPVRLRAMGVADIRPIASNATPEGRAQNRRVEIVLEAPPQPR